MNSKRKFIHVDFTMSYEEYEEGFIMPEFHFHEDYEVYLLERGERIVSVGKEELLTKPGDIVFFAKNEPHKSRGSEGFAGICIHFSERFLKQYFTEVSIEKMLSVFSARKLHLCQEHMNTIQKMTKEFVIGDEYNFLRLAKIFKILQEAEPTALPAISNSNKKSTQIFAYVDENYAYIKELKDLTQLFEISEGYLFKLYQNQYDMTPKTYINQLKIQNICNRLKYSNAPIKNIAAAYGYESYEHFCRIFKKEMGCTPTEYRKRV